MTLNSSLTLLRWQVWLRKARVSPGRSKNRRLIMFRSRWTPRHSMDLIKFKIRYYRVAINTRWLLKTRLPDRHLKSKIWQARWATFRPWNSLSCWRKTLRSWKINSFTNISLIRIFSDWLNKFNFILVLI